VAVKSAAVRRQALASLHSDGCGRDDADDQVV
jgi:hypothetical protein